MSVPGVAAHQLIVDEGPGVHLGLPDLQISLSADLACCMWRVSCSWLASFMCFSMQLPNLLDCGSPFWAAVLARSKLHGLASDQHPVCSLCQ